MIMSPGSNSSASSLMVLSVASPAGTMTHTMRGAVSAATISSRLATVRSDSGERSYPTTSCPAAAMRFAILPPIRPRPIIASCMMFFFLRFCLIWNWIVEFDWDWCRPPAFSIFRNAEKKMLKNE